MMKKIVLLLTGIMLTINLFGQAKKPTLMVIPSDAWCINNGYSDVLDNQGSEVVVPNYKKALQSDMDLSLAIAKINSLMADRGFPLKNLESTLKSIERRQAEDNMTASKTSGAELAVSPLDMLSKTAKADIIIQLGWKVNTVGPKKSVTYILQGLDAYTDKQIAGAEGTGVPSFTAEVPLLLEEAVVVNMDNFTARLQDHFNDLFENGREAIIEVKVFDNGSGMDLESEYDDTELSEIIDDWMHMNSVKHRYSQSDASENFMLFEQVRMPLFNAKGRAMDANRFVRQLRKYLKSTYLIESKVLNKGLGRAVIILGEK